MATHEKPAFGVTISDNTSSQTHLRPQPSMESHVTSSDAESHIDAKKNTEHDLANPFNANQLSNTQGHPSDELQKTPTSARTHLCPYNTDLEAGSGLISQTTTIQPKVSLDGRVKECTMWPSKQSLMDKEKERKRRQGGWWNIMTNMSRKQKLWFRFVVVLLLVAAAVGIGVGVSRAVGGGVWAGNGKTKNIDPQ